MLHQALGITTLEQLAKAAREHRISSLPRFSTTIEAKILDEITKHRTTEQRFKISTAKDFAAGLVGNLRSAPGITEVVVAGSFWRRRETVGDLDILATRADGTAAIEHFVAYDEVETLLSKGPTRSTVLLKAGIQVDLRVVAEESYGAVDLMVSRVVREWDTPLSTRPPPSASDAYVQRWNPFAAWQGVADPYRKSISYFTPLRRKARGISAVQGCVARSAGLRIRINLGHRNFLFHRVIWL